MRDNIRIYRSGDPEHNNYYSHILDNEFLHNNIESIKDEIENALNKNYDYLHRACALSANVDMIKMLIEKGFDVNSKSSFHGTPLLCALGYYTEFNINMDDKTRNEIENNLFEIAKLLIHYGANVNAMVGNFSIFEYACMLNKFNIVKLLVENGVDFKRKSLMSNRSAIYYSICNQHSKANIDVVNYLLEIGIDFLTDEFIEFNIMYARENYEVFRRIMNAFPEEYTTGYKNCYDDKFIYDDNFPISKWIKIGEMVYINLLKLPI